MMNSKRSSNKMTKHYIETQLVGPRKGKSGGERKRQTFFVLEKKKRGNNKAKEELKKC